MPVAETKRLSVDEMLPVEDVTVKIPLFDSESLLTFDTRSVAEGAMLSNVDIRETRSKSNKLCDPRAFSIAEVTLLVTEALAATFR